MKFKFFSTRKRKMSDLSFYLYTPRIIWSNVVDCLEMTIQ